MSSERAMNATENVGAAGLGTVIGLLAQWLSLIPALPAWIGQAAVTLLVSGLAIVLNHFMKRELNRRWPDRRRREGDTGE